MGGCRGSAGYATLSLGLMMMLRVSMRLSYTCMLLED
jgi:hypothetical protein